MNVNGPMTVRQPRGSHQRKNMSLLSGGGVGFSLKNMQCLTVHLFMLKCDDFFVTLCYSFISSFQIYFIRHIWEYSPVETLWKKI